MKYFIFMLCVWLQANHILAQNSLSGTVTSEANAEPIPATIYLPQLEIGTDANLDGQFNIEGIPNGTYTVVCSFLGYTTVSRKITFSGDTEIKQSFSLKESVVEMEAVIISTLFHKLQGENVMKVERMDVNELSKNGATTLAQGITAIPGVSTISTGLGIGKPVIRGLSANRVLVYSQGVRLENQQFGDEHGLGVNAAGISSVEVIKGPASLLYGSDALGGVLYLNPEGFAAVGDFEADATGTYYSNTDGYSLNAGAKQSGEKFKFLLRLATDAHSDYKTGDDIRVTNSRFKESDFKGGLRFQHGKLKSTLRYNLTKATIGIPEEIGIQSGSKNEMVPFQEIDNHLLSLENNIFFDRSSLDITAGYVHNNRREYEEFESPELQMKLNTFNYTVKYNLPQYGKFETIVGIQGMFQQNENFGEEILIPDAEITDFGILATTHYHLDKADFQAGIRYDHRALKSEAAGDAGDPEYIPALDTDFSSFNAALGGKFDLSEKLVGRINLASGFRAPNLAELTSNGVHEGTNRYEIGNPGLENEQNYQLDISLEYGNEHFEVFANGFYNHINNYIFIQPTGDVIDGDEVFTYVQGDSHLYGGEFGVHLHPHPLDWLHIESSFQLLSGSLIDGGELPLIPANTFKNTLNITLPDGRVFKENNCFVRLENVLDQENISTFETRTGGYSLLNLGGGSSLELKGVDISFKLAVSNLFNKTYISHMSRLKTDGIPNIGRNISATISLSI